MKPHCNAIEKPVQDRMLRRSPKTRPHIFAIHLFAILCSLCFLLFNSFCPPRASAATVWGNLLDLHLNALNTPLTWYPTNLVTVTPNAGGGLQAGPAFTSYPTNGFFTNVVDAGDFRVCLQLNTWRNCFTLTVPAGNGTYNITNLLSNKILADGGSGAILANP